MYRLQKRVGLGAHRRPVLRTHVTRGGDGAPGHGTEPALELGHHLPAHGDPRAVPSPVSGHGRLEPSHRGLGRA